MITSTLINVDVVEDLDIDYIALQRAFKKSSYGAQARLRRFKTGAELLNHYEQGDLPDLLLVDINLTDTNGLELLGRLQDMARTRLVPKVICSSSSNPADVNRGFFQGASGFLVKPLGNSELTEKIQKLLTYWFEVSARPGLVA